jgi:16S rRNA (cytosine967-C5)-methyltransferase
MSEIENTQDRRLAASAVEGGRLGALLLDLWQRTRMDWGFVSDKLSSTFRREKWLGSHERRFVAETLYGMVRHLRRIDAGLSAARRGAPPTDRDRLIAYLVLSGSLHKDAAHRAARDVDWPRALAVDEWIAKERRPATRIALRYSLPDWLADKLLADWGDEAEDVARGLNERAPMTVRVNRLVATRDEVQAELAALDIVARPGAYSADALILDTRVNLFGLATFKRGAIEAQDEGSQLLAEIADPHGVVIDLCAGAGGKTLAMAALMKNRGRIVATDVDGKKLEELRRRARRATVSNAQAIELGNNGEWPDALEALRGKADRVLVDAPCSGIGALRRNPEARWRLTAADLDGFAALQAEIAIRAAALVAPGGRMIYATCTVLRGENQEVVDAIRAAVPALELVPAVEAWRTPRADAAALATPDGQFMAVRPDRHGTDGFFAAIFRRPK